MGFFVDPLGSCVRARIVTVDVSVFETRSDNILLSSTSPRYAYIEIQADMKMVEVGWNLRLLRALLKYDDILGVSGRCASGLVGNKTVFQKNGGIQFGNRVGRCSGKELETFELHNHDSNVIHVRNSAIRGPLILHAQKVQKLAFFDEINHLLGKDDHDLFTRANLLYNWYGAYCEVGMVSKMAWGASRRHSKTKSKSLKFQKLEKGYLDSRRARIGKSFGFKNRAKVKVVKETRRF